MSGLLVGVALIAMVIGIAQYRAILWPLARMKLAVERIAAGRFNGRVDTEGTLEFAELAVNFNRMATRLEDLYHNLQQQRGSQEPPTRPQRTPRQRGPAGRGRGP